MVTVRPGSGNLVKIDSRPVPWRPERRHGTGAAFSLATEARGHARLLIPERRRSRPCRRGTGGPVLADPPGAPVGWRGDAPVAAVAPALSEATPGAAVRAHDAAG